MAQKPETETQVVSTDQGEIKITRPKGSMHSGVTVLLGEPREYVREGFGGFVDFLREKAVVGLAVGFIIGQQAQAVIKQFVDSFITPILNVAIGDDLQNRMATIGSGDNAETVAWGKFLYIFISFIFVLFTIYVVVKLFKLDRLDKPADKKKKK